MYALDPNRPDEDGIKPLSVGPRYADHIVELFFPDLTPSFPFLGKQAREGCPFSSFLRSTLLAECSLQDTHILKAEKAVEIRLPGSWPHFEDKGTIFERYKSKSRFKIRVLIHEPGSEQIHLAFKFAFKFSSGIYPTDSTERVQTITNWPTAPEFSVQQVAPLADANIDNVMRWLRDCDVNHSACHTLSPEFTPSRLLKVNSDTIRLISDRQDKCRYLALSYCWGRVKDDQKGFLTTKENIRRRKSGFNIQELPSTIQDAIQTARRLQLEYIWIDAICIIQDDIEDWKREASQMGDIYRHAYLTLAATNSSSSFDGFLKDRQPSVNASQGFVFREFQSSPSGHSVKAIGTVYFRYPVETKPSGHLSKCEWDRRGWTLQERLLSSRILFFSKDVIHWECPTTQGIEDPAYKLPPRISYSTLLSQSQSLTEDQQVAKKQHYYASWYEIVELFSSRRITVPSDKLPAVSGLAATYQTLINDRYIFGLWRSDLHRGLLWRTTGLWKTPAYGYRAPTWSWACKDGPLSWHETTSATEWKSLIQVLDILSARSGCTECWFPYGTKLEISAPIAPLKDVLQSFLSSGDDLDSRKYDPWNDLDTWNDLGTWDPFDELGSFVVDTKGDEPLELPDLYMMLVAVAESSVVQALILQPTGKCGCYRRVAWFISQEDEYLDFLPCFQGFFLTRKSFLE
ncbi:HET-domain-containing protein [Xylariaceae sp. FL0255]|nr:HET-domain-containing protein [Xylariaceae sp. FL0255]